MKNCITIFLFLITACGISQNLNGNYTSTLTSFNDVKNSDNNFNEETLFTITINYDSTKKNSNNYILIQDPRTPDQTLTYEIQKKSVKIPSSKLINSSYLFKDCLNLKTKAIYDIVIYYNKQNELNLMISDKNYSQAFKKLIKKK